MKVYVWSIKLKTKSQYQIVGIFNNMIDLEIAQTCYFKEMRKREKLFKKDLDILIEEYELNKIYYDH